MKFVEILTDTRTQFGPFYNGEIRKVDAEVAGFLIGAGWARNCESATIHETSSAEIDPVTLEVQSVKVGVQAEEVNHG